MLSDDDAAIMVRRLKGLNEWLYRMSATDLHLVSDMLADYERPGAESEMRLVRFRADALKFLLSVIDSTPVQSDVPSASRIYSLIMQMRRNPEKGYPIESLTAETQMSETSLATAFKCELGNQNGGLCQQTDKHNYGSLHVDIVVNLAQEDEGKQSIALVPYPGKAISTHQTGWYRQKNCPGDEEALVEHAQDKEYQYAADSVDEI